MQEPSPIKPVPVVPTPKLIPEKTTAEKVATVATIAVSLFVANWLANKLVGNRPEFKVHNEPVKSRFLPW